MSSSRNENCDNQTNENSMPGLLFLISGPSGSGKGTVITKIREIYPNIIYPTSCTTRERRVGEVEGNVYNYISKADFEKKIEAGEFLEYALVHGLNYYGMLKSQVLEPLKKGSVVIREVDVQGFLNIKKVVPADNLVSIFLKADSVESLITRITRRSAMSEEEVALRMESAEKEMSMKDLFDYQVWSLDGKIGECIDEVSGIIQKEVKKRNLSL